MHWIARATTHHALGLLVGCTLLVPGCSKGWPKAGDRDLLVTIEQYQPFGLQLPPDYAQYEAFERERWFDGSVVLNLFQHGDESQLVGPALTVLARRDG